MLITMKEVAEIYNRSEPVIRSYIKLGLAPENVTTKHSYDRHSTYNCSRHSSAKYWDEDQILEALPEVIAHQKNKASHGNAVMNDKAKNFAKEIEPKHYKLFNEISNKLIHAEIIE